MADDSRFLFRSSAAVLFSPALVRAPRLALVSRIWRPNVPPGAWPGDHPLTSDQAAFVGTADEYLAWFGGQVRTVTEIGARAVGAGETQSFLAAAGVSPGPVEPGHPLWVGDDDQRLAERFARWTGGRDIGLTPVELETCRDLCLAAAKAVRPDASGLPMCPRVLAGLLGKYADALEAGVELPSPM